MVPVTKKQKESAAFGELIGSEHQKGPQQSLDGTDALHCIYRTPVPPITSQTSHLAAKHPPHIPATLRSAKLPVPKANAAIRITELLVEMGVNAQRLVMPTRSNLDAFDGLLQAAAALVDMKRQVDRVEQEMRTLRAQRDGFVPPIERKSVSELGIRTAVGRERLSLTR